MKSELVLEIYMLKAHCVYLVYIQKSEFSLSYASHIVQRLGYSAFKESLLARKDPSSILGMGGVSFCSVLI